jgi:ferredoxin
MSQQLNKHPLNVIGRYYVEYDCCINHEACTLNAPDNIRMDRANFGAYVFQQPATPEEEARCRQAMEECPVGAIHDDGDA